MVSVQFLVSLFLLIVFPLNSANQVYTDHCGLTTTIPKSTRTNVSQTNFPFTQYDVGYYYAGENMMFDSNFSSRSNSFSLRGWTLYGTELDGVFMVKSRLVMRRNFHATDFVNSSSTRRQLQVSVNLWMNGFWSESSKQLCMIGNSIQGRRTTTQRLDVVLKLYGISNSTNVTSLITGTLESLNGDHKDKNNFKPMSVLIFPPKNYKYTLAPLRGCSGSNDETPKGLLIDPLYTKSFCLSQIFTAVEFNLNYANDCNSAQNCSPFDGIVGYLPSTMSLRNIDCLEDEKKLRLMLEFHKDSMYYGFDPRVSFVKTLVGEGSWDEKNNQLCVTACLLLGVTDSLAKAHVGECSTRLSLKIPAIWSIKDSSTVFGQIWSNKAANESGYFKKILFQTSERSLTAQRAEYEYTVIDKVEKVCPKKKLDDNDGEIYPSADSFDMRFDMWGKSSNRTYTWGSAYPLSVGDKIYEQTPEIVSSNSGWSPSSRLVVPESSNIGSPVNISYHISIAMQGFLKPEGEPDRKPDGLFSLFNTSSNGKIEILAEGIYDGKSGSLCMIGCRKYGFASMDCEILVKFQFPSSNSKSNQGYINGTIESTRKKSDSLYFENFKVRSVTYLQAEAHRSVQRMNMEIIMALMSNTFACIFVILQLFHVKKNPEGLSGVSLVTVMILTLGHMIPSVLDLGAMLLPNRDRQNNILLHTGGWLDINEIVLTAVTMVAFVLQARLLQLTWQSKSDDDSWFFEKATSIVTLPFYALGATIAWLVNSSWKTQKDVFIHSSRLMENSLLWINLKSSGGLVLDGFLLPQILLNIFRSSEKNALTRSFYIGYTCIRVLPHVYDLYRSHYYNPDFDGSYYYAKHDADFFSTSWDIITSLVCMSFAMIVYMQ
ncbi:hypothetical protein ACFE04_006991 [Oxalis oulophora]